MLHQRIPPRFSVDHGVVQLPGSDRIIAALPDGTYRKIRGFTVRESVSDMGEDWLAVEDADGNLQVAAIWEAKRPL